MVRRLKQDISVSSIDKSDGNIDVELKVNKENDIVEAFTRRVFHMWKSSKRRCIKGIQSNNKF